MWLAQLKFPLRKEKINLDTLRIHSARSLVFPQKKIRKLSEFEDNEKTMESWEVKG